MKKSILVALVLLCVLTNGLWARGKKDNRIYNSPDGWRFLYGEEVSREKGERANTPGHNGGKIFRIVANERDGDYSIWGIDLPEDMQLVWNKESQVIVRLKNGKQIASEACFFTESARSDVLWDTRRERIVVSRNAGKLWIGGNKVLRVVIVAVKFPIGSFRISDVETVMVANVRTTSFKTITATQK